VHPATCLRLQEDFPALHVIDAPVSGGGHQAAAGALLVMIGGPGDVVDRCRPVLETFGDPVLHVGPLGSGQEVKVLNNTAFAAQLALAADVFAIAAARGIDQEQVAKVLASGSGRSYATEIVAGSGYDLGVMAQLAGELLAKDVGILVDRAGSADSTLVAAADAALDRRGVART
jgi:3-hydroxyisobutyrate dehydrogenase-like beta-hydroxyacid dehydrogenase